MGKNTGNKLGSHMSESEYLKLKENEKVKEGLHNPFLNGFAVEEEMVHFFAYVYGFDEKAIRPVEDVTVYKPLCNGSYKKHHYSRSPVYVDEEHNYARFDTYSPLENKHWEYVNGQIYVYREEEPPKTSKYSAVVTISTAVAVDADSSDDAIEKIYELLKNNEGALREKVRANVDEALENGNLEVTDAIPL